MEEKKDQMTDGWKDRQMDGWTKINKKIQNDR